MKPKHQRMLFLLGSLIVMSLAASAILYSFRDNIVFFYTPSQLSEKRTTPDFNIVRPLRIGGLVKNGSVSNLEGGGVRFTITDLNTEITVTYRGLMPSLFRDGQGIVAQGTIGTDGVMNAQSILARHDEKYMPREVVDALKASGKWREPAQ